uniref:Uncharacterized protein n=1 Tax=Arundo donax TaxID=35708 RepID=A0A0A9H3V7_ARUDO
MVQVGRGSTMDRPVSEPLIHQPRKEHRVNPILSAACPIMRATHMGNRRVYYCRRPHFGG